MYICLCRSARPGTAPNVPSFLTVSCCLCQHLSIMDSAADILKQLPGDYHHVFDLVHFILCIQGDRADLGDG